MNHLICILLQHRAPNDSHRVETKFIIYSTDSTFPENTKTLFGCFSTRMTFFDKFENLDELTIAPYTKTVSNEYGMGQILVWCWHFSSLGRSLCGPTSKFGFQIEKKNRFFGESIIIIIVRVWRISFTSFLVYSQLSSSKCSKKFPQSRYRSDCILFDTIYSILLIAKTRCRSDKWKCRAAQPNRRWQPNGVLQLVHTTSVIPSASFYVKFTLDFESCIHTRNQFLSNVQIIHSIIGLFFIIFVDESRKIGAARI